MANLVDERNACPRFHHLHQKLEPVVEAQVVLSSLDTLFGVDGRMSEVLRLSHWQHQVLEFPPEIEISSSVRLHFALDDFFNLSFKIPSLDVSILLHVHGCPWFVGSTHPVASCNWTPNCLRRSNQMQPEQRSCSPSPHELSFVGVRHSIP